jgi:universal stress protein A
MPPPNPPKYLVAIDGSPGSRRALDVAMRLAKGADAELDVVTVEDYRQVARDLRNPRQAARVMRKVRESCDTLVERARQRASKAGIETHSRVLDSDEPAATLAGFAKSQGADLIIVGSRGRSQARQMVLGSVAERVVRLAPCTVVVVR